MKDIVNYINESANKDAMFLGLTSRRTDDDFEFKPGEKVLLIKYDTYGQEAQVRSGNLEVEKVLKNSIRIKDADDPDDTFYKELKFDKKGIFVKKNNNKYLGKSTLYWVLYNKELADDEDLKELLDRGGNSWGFHIADGRFHDDYIKTLKKKIKELKK